jgi:diadenosine tetraphosphate (Ap4A) HIT family hydrolase
VLKCAECAALGPGSPTRVVRRGPLAVHAKLEPGGVPGWMVVAPVRHVEALEDLDPAEQAALLPLVAEVAAALRAETPCAKTYLAAFAEVVPHLHVHVIARPPDLAESDRGAKVFAAHPVAAEAADAVGRRVLALLERQAARPGPAAPDAALRAALLSALVLPGAGQLKNRQVAKGLALAAAALAAAGLFFVRLLSEALSALPPDGAFVDPLAAWDLVQQVRERNQWEFLGYSVALGLLWIYATYDAWAVARRRGL